jgi:hypothetical protein
MARDTRIHSAGGLYYIVLKAASKSGRRLDGLRNVTWESLFRNAEERRAFFQLLPLSIKKTHVRVHDFCATATDVRLLVEVSDVPLGRFVQHLCTRYSRTANRMRGRSGHLFRQRYQSVLLNGEATGTEDAEAAVREVVHHIARTPVEAHMTEAPGEYEWSSYGGHVGKDCIRWLTSHRVLKLFNAEADLARRSYTRCIGSPVSGEEWRNTGRTEAPRRFVTGDAEFIRWIKVQLKHQRKPATLDQLIDTACMRVRVSRPDLLSASRIRKLSMARALVAHYAAEWNIAVGSEVARTLNRDPSTLYVGVERYRLLHRELFSLPLDEFLDTGGIQFEMEPHAPSSRRAADTKRVELSDAQWGIRLARALLREAPGRPRALRTARG